MDFDALIPIVIFLLFFIFPTVFKIVIRKKKNSQPNILGKIGDQVQKFVQELEQQGQQQHKTEARNVWEMFEEASGEPIDEKTIQELPEKKPLPPKLSPEKMSLRTSEKRLLSKKQDVSIETVFPARNFSIKANPLQNAVVWSEILASPLALRNKN